MTKYVLCAVQFVALLSLFVLQPQSFAQDSENQAAADELVEIIVTGTRITGNVDSASALVQVDFEEQYDNPSVTISEFLRENVTANFSQEVFEDEGLRVGRVNGNRVAGPNIWGLGEENTLTFLNGSRIALNPLPSGRGWLNTDLNAILPGIAIQRTDVLLNGGSAIYGTDAVAGVVNLIPRYRFTGFEVRAQTEVIPSEISRYGSRNIEAIFGTGFNDEKGSFIIAGNFTDTSLNDADALGLNGQNTPEFTSPVTADDVGTDPGQILNRSAYGNYGGGMGRAADPLLTDPLCGAVDMFPGEPYWYFGEVAPRGVARRGECLQYNAPRTDGRDSGRWTVFSAIQYDVNDELQLSAELSRHQRTQFDLIRFGDAAALRIRNDIPSSHPGILYNRSIDPTWAGAAIGPSLFYASSVDRPVGYETEQKYESESTFLKLSSDWAISDALQFELSAVLSENEAAHPQTRTRKDRYSNALAGLGGPDCDPVSGTRGAGGCEYYNPFFSALLPDAASLGLANSDELLEWLIPTDDAIRVGNSKLMSIDALLNITTGISLPGGDISVALGASYKEEENSVRYSEGFRSAVYLGLDSALENFTGNRENEALFAEFLFPIGENFNVQLAGRLDDYSDVGSTFNPKLGVVWDVSDRATLRASYGESFKAPTVLHTQRNVITLTFPPQPTGGRNFPRTPLSGVSGPLGGSLEPQTAEILSLGGDFVLIDGWNRLEDLSLSVSYVDISFKNQIGFLIERSRVPAVQDRGVSALGDCGRTTGSDFDGLREIGIDTGAPCFEFTHGAVPVGTDPRDGADLFAASDLTVSYRLYSNFSGAELEGVDFRLNSTVDTPIGSLRAGLNLTYMLEYTVGQIGGMTGTFDVVGIAGATGGANRDVPEFNINMPLRMRWSDDGWLGGHSTSLTARYSSEIDNTNGTTNTGALTTVDLQHGWDITENSSIRLTVRNLVESKPYRPGDPFLLVREGVRTYYLNFALTY